MDNTTPTKTVYITIGNSDNRLSQYDWASLWEEVDSAIRFSSHNMGRPVIHGAWQSPSVSPYQNACWCVELSVPLELRLRRMLAQAAFAYEQDSITWAQVSDVEFVKPGQ
jgi:hypothetical protein